MAARGGAPDRVFLAGHSSGAHLSLLLATDPKYLARHRLSASDVAGVIGLSPPVDLQPRADGKGFGDALMAGRGADVFSRDPADHKTSFSYADMFVQTGMPSTVAYPTKITDPEKYFAEADWPWCSCSSASSRIPWRVC